MAESTLSLAFATINAEVGLMLGYSATLANWSAEEIADIARVLNAGTRQFYGAHNWSFLHINTTLVTVADDYDQTLPDSFGGLEGGFTFATTDGAYREVKVVGEEQIRALRQGNTLTGIPQFAAVRMRSTDGTAGQKFEVIWWPTPDAVYTLGYSYRVQPDALSSGAPYPLGGMVHSETLLASALAIVEERMDGVRGIQWQAYQGKLAQSIAYDNSLGQQFFGYNGDRSDAREYSGNMKKFYSSGPTYMGVQYPS